MSSDLLKFYPVDNGDTTLIKLSDGTTILIDCKIRDIDTNTDGYSVFDVKSDLLNELRKIDGKPHVDVFILTHPDEDHCLGFEKNFYIGTIDDYPEEESGKIIIDELWVTPMIFNGSLSNNDAKAVRKEAKRRRKLYDESDSSKEVRTNRLRVVGYDGEENLENVPHYHPGNVIAEFAGVIQSDFSFFVHAPLRADIIEGKSDDNKNLTSIVLQARFRSDWENENYGTRVLLAGDADQYNWDKILEKTEDHGNEECLKWNIFLAPHHCSWTFFNDVPYDKSEENKIPQEHSIKIIDEYKLDDSQIIASSKRIKNNGDNPPHYPAYQQYIKYLDNEDQFISLAETPKPSETQPVVFEIDDDGCRRADEGVNSEKDKRAGAGLLSATSASSGNWCDLDEV